jgi:aspartate-semialdehyde dehydrogenase
MVGSVLVQRMLRGGLRSHRSGLFSTSNAGAPGPKIGKSGATLKDAADVRALSELDTIITCQGGDWTKPMHAKLRGAGWNGYWIDAASTLRMADDAVIVLDPVNMNVIEAALARGVRNYIGGNCTVSLMMMALAGLLKRDLVEWMTCMTYQSASGAGAQNMRELLQQMGEAHLAAKELLDDPASSILDIDREVAGILRDDRFPTEHTGVPLAGSLIPWIAEDMGNGVSKEEWKGGAETNKILGREGAADSDQPICVRVGAMRCHSQALTIKLKRSATPRSKRCLPTRMTGSGSCPTNARRACASSRLPRSPASSRFRSVVCASSRSAIVIWARSPSAISCCGAPPSRCAACCASCWHDSGGSR